MRTVFLVKVFRLEGVQAHQLVCADTSETIAFPKPDLCVMTLGILLCDLVFELALRRQCYWEDLENCVACLQYCVRDRREPC